MLSYLVVLTSPVSNKVVFRNISGTASKCNRLEIYKGILIEDLNGARMFLM